MRQLSDFLRFPDSALRHSALRKAAEALPFLDKLHRLDASLSNRPTVEIRASLSRREEGSYRIKSGAPNLPDRIFISQHAAWPRLTFLHEVAHYLDNQWLHPLKQGFASTYDEDFLSLKSIWNKSPTIANLRWLLNRYAPQMTHLDRRIFSESLLDNEIWARAYAQWAVLKSDNRDLLAECETSLQTIGLVGTHAYTIQWPEKEFMPLLEAVDNLLKVKKLL